MRLWAGVARSRCGSTRRERRLEPRSWEWRWKPMLKIDRDGRVLRLTLNRPEKRNALNGALCEQLAAAIASADADPGVGAILLTGAGKSFCSGMDLGEMLTPAA